MRDAARSFPTGSAPGPNGLRSAHLKDCLGHAGAASALEGALVTFVRKAAEGLLAPALRRVLCASSLVPLQKKDGGIRPVAVGDTMRRVVGKFLLRTGIVREQVATLRPRQCGVGVPFAAEHVGMGMCGLVHGVDVREAPWVALQVDMRNAFNCVDRTAMLTVALTKTPAAYSWLAWCYAEAAPLLCQG